jgi:hypothetical protein
MLLSDISEYSDNSWLISLDLSPLDDSLDLSPLDDSKGDLSELSS